MSRPLCIEYANAWYHVMNRGRRHEKIFTCTGDYKKFRALFTNLILLCFIGFHFIISKYSTVNSITEQIKNMVKPDYTIRKKIENLKNAIINSQQQICPLFYKCIEPVWKWDSQFHGCVEMQIHEFVLYGNHTALWKISLEERNWHFRASINKARFEMIKIII